MPGVSVEPDIPGIKGDQFFFLPSIATCVPGSAQQLLMPNRQCSDERLVGSCAYDQSWGYALASRSQNMNPNWCIG